MQHPVDDQLLTEPAVRALLGNVSSMTLWRWLKRGILPAPLSISRRNYWRASEIRTWMDSQKRRAGAAA